MRINVFPALGQCSASNALDLEKFSLLEDGTHLNYTRYKKKPESLMFTLFARPSKLQNIWTFVYLTFKLISIWFSSGQGAWE